MVFFIFVSVTSTFEENDKKWTRLESKRASSPIWHLRNCRFGHKFNSFSISRTIFRGFYSVYKPAQLFPENELMVGRARGGLKFFGSGRRCSSCWSDTRPRYQRKGLSEREERLFMVTLSEKTENAENTGKARKYLLNRRIIGDQHKKQSHQRRKNGIFMRRRI